MQIEFDTPGDARPEHYWQGEAADLFPHLLAPLSWTLIGPSIEQGIMRSLIDDLAIAGRGPACTATGRLAGRLHLNRNLTDTVMTRVPGLDPAPVNGSRPPRSSAAAERIIATLARRISREAELVRAAGADNAAFLAGEPGPSELVTRARGLLPLYRDTFRTHVTGRTLAASATGVAAQALRRTGTTSDDAVAMLSTLPRSDGARPGRALADIAASIDPGGALGRALTAGMSWDELSTSTLPEADRARTELTRFLLDYGHRGYNEFDPCAPAWGSQPDAVLALVRPLLERVPRPEPMTGASPTGLNRGQRALVWQARRAIQTNEHTEDNLVRATHLLRRLLDQAGDQLAPLLGRDEMAALSIDELAQVAGGAEVPRTTVERRLAELAAADRAGGTCGPEPALRTGRCPGDLVRGRTGSPGSAAGPVRIVHSADNSFSSGDVLVTTVPDPSWTPLFLAAAAVVVDDGGPLSPAMIVAREVGVPAVVKARRATTTLVDGDLVEVDGTSGVVRLVACRP